MENLTNEWASPSMWDAVERVVRQWDGFDGVDPESFYHFRPGIKRIDAGYQLGIGNTGEDSMVWGDNVFDSTEAVKEAYLSLIRDHNPNPYFVDFINSGDYPVVEYVGYRN